MTENGEETFEKPRKNLNESFKKEEFVVKRGRGRPPKKKSSIQISYNLVPLAVYLGKGNIKQD